VTTLILAPGKLPEIRRAPLQGLGDLRAGESHDVDGHALEGPVALCIRAGEAGECGAREKRGTHRHLGYHAGSPPWRTESPVRFSITVAGGADANMLV
jgi:hypothetical protein